MAELRVAQTEWDGQPALLASFRDVTERKRLEEELRRQADLLAEADRRKDRFLAMLRARAPQSSGADLECSAPNALRDDDLALRNRMRDVVEQQAKHIAPCRRPA